MKYPSLVLLLISFLNCSAQEPLAALQSPEINVLYRGYSNIIVPAVTNNNGRTVELTGTNVEIVQRGESNTYEVYPGKGRSATIHVLLVEGEDSVTVLTMPYRIQTLPDATIYWGGTRNNGKANIRESKLFAKYPPHIPLKAVFSIVQWSLVHKGDTISGKGSNVSCAQDLFKTIKEKTTLNFEVHYVGPDGVTRIQNAKWTVFPWKDEKNETKVFKCG